MQSDVAQRKSIVLEYQPTANPESSCPVVIDSMFDSGNLGKAYFDCYNRSKVILNDKACSQNRA